MTPRPRKARRFEKAECARIIAAINEAVATENRADLPELHADLHAIAMHTESRALRKAALAILNIDLADAYPPRNLQRPGRPSAYLPGRSARNG